MNLGIIAGTSQPSRAVEGYLGDLVEHVTAVPLLAEAIRPHLPPHPIIVSPDFGAPIIVDSPRRGRIGAMSPAAQILRDGGQPGVRGVRRPLTIA